MDRVPAEVLALVAAHLVESSPASLARACRAGLGAARLAAETEVDRAQLALALGRNVCVDLPPRNSEEDDESDAAVGRRLVSAAMRSVKADRLWCVLAPVNVVHVTPSPMRAAQGAGVDAEEAERMVYFGDLLDMYRFYVDEECALPTRCLNADDANELVLDSRDARKRRAGMGGTSGRSFATSIRVPVLQTPPHRCQQLLQSADVLVLHDFDALSLADLHFLGLVVRKLYLRRNGRARLPQLLLIGRGRSLHASNATRLERAFGGVPIREGSLFRTARIVRLSVHSTPPAPLPPPAPAPLALLTGFVTISSCSRGGKLNLTLGGLAAVKMAIVSEDAQTGEALILRAGTVVRVDAVFDGGRGVGVGGRATAANASVHVELGGGRMAKIGAIKERDIADPKDWKRKRESDDSTTPPVMRIPLVPLVDGELLPIRRGNWTLLDNAHTA